MENKREWIEFLLKKSKFQLTEEEMVQFEKDLDVFLQQLQDLDRFDLEGVEPQTMPFDKKESILRPDEVVVENRPEQILKNASKVKDGYIFLEKEEK